MSSSRHQMPFGTEVLGNGHIAFRLWAPAAKSVELCLYALDSQGGFSGDNFSQDNFFESTYFELHQQARGWFELITDKALPSSFYKYRIDKKFVVPDPASRSNPFDVEGPCQVVDPASYDWHDRTWTGRPWESTVIYEIHTGTFTPEGTFRAIVDKLDHLVSLGITALELMPIADFPGSRNWGYDGVLLYAPDSSYGTPDDLKFLVDECHQRGLMVFLDVVYNHFGPKGNYLNLYAPQFFSRRDHTPWGVAINYAGKQSRAVRDFFIHNALYWLEEYHFDGLRLDAVQSILDKSKKHILYELAEAVYQGPGKERHCHLVLENEENAAHYLKFYEPMQRRLYDAQWNDDLHNVAHVILTGEREGYYSDYSSKPLWYLGRCLSEGFAYQGETSIFRKKIRGEVSRGLPSTSFVSFMQNHDRVGNLPFGDRLHSRTSREALYAMTEILLIAPGIPLFFMGDEFQATTPFLFFCDFDGELARAVKRGRDGDYKRRGLLQDSDSRSPLDPNSFEAFHNSKINWRDCENQSNLDYYHHVQRLLDIRAKEILPNILGLAEIGLQQADSGFEILDEQVLHVWWGLNNRRTLRLLANLGKSVSAVGAESLKCEAGRAFYRSHHAQGNLIGGLYPWSVEWRWSITA